MMSENFTTQRIRTSILTPEDIELIILEGLQAYASGEITGSHLTRILKKQLVGNSTKLSFKIVELLPKFNKLISLLEMNGIIEDETMEKIEDIVKNLQEAEE